jgi:hypothetical protein
MLVLESGEEQQAYVALTDRAEQARQRAHLPASALDAIRPLPIGDDRQRFANASRCDTQLMDGRWVSFTGRIPGALECEDSFPPERVTGALNRHGRIVEKVDYSVAPYGGKSVLPSTSHTPAGQRLTLNYACG